MAKPLDRTGQRYGTWTALRPSTRRRKRTIFWVCRCDCGAIKEIARFSETTCCRACGYKKRRSMAGDQNPNWGKTTTTVAEHAGRRAHRRKELGACERC